MMRRRRALLGIVGLTAALATVAAACSSSPGSGSAKKGHVTLQLWAYPGYEDVLPPTVSAFNAKFGPAITVHETVIPENVYSTKLDLAISAHSGPDLAIPANPLDLPAGHFLPLNSLFANAGINLASFNPGAIDASCKWSGQVYCMGNFLGADITYYNKALFSKAGVSFPPANKPLTVDQYVADSCKIYHATGTWGAASGDPYTWLARDNYVTPNGQYAHLVTPSLIDVYTKIGMMYKDKCAPSLSVFDPWNRGADEFALGKMAMVITDDRGIAKIEHAGIDYGIAPVPVPAGAHPEVEGWTDSTGIVKGTAHPAQAWQFVKFLATGGQSVAVKVAGDFPLNAQVAVQDHWAKNAGRRDFLQVEKLTQPEVYIPNIWNISLAVYGVFTDVLNGMPARQALQKAQSTYQTELDQAWQTYMRGTGGHNPNQGITYK